MYLSRTSDGPGTRVEGLMAAFAELRPQIGIAPACVARSINRAGIYRARDHLARRHCAMFPRKRRLMPPLALSEAERSVLLLILNSERFADLAPAAVFAILLEKGRYPGWVRTFYGLRAGGAFPGKRPKNRPHGPYVK